MQIPTKPAIPYKLILSDILYIISYKVWKKERLFSLLKCSLFLTKISPTLNLNQQSTYKRSWIMSIPHFMKLRKAAPPLKEGGKSKTNTVPGISMILQSKHSINRSMICTQTQYTQDFHINTTPYTYDQIHKNVFLPCLNQKDEQAPGNLSSCLTVYLVHLFFFGKQAHCVEFPFS